MLRLALAQLDLTVGALAENRKRIADACADAARAGADLVLAPELGDLGLPARGSAAAPRVPARLPGRGRAARRRGRGAARRRLPVARRRPRAQRGARARRTAPSSRATTSASCPTTASSTRSARSRPAAARCTSRRRGGALALTICEDVWLPDAVAEAAALGAICVLNISASPYHLGKGQAREEMLATRARDGLCAVAYCNLVGGQDELVFDGRSAVFGPDGSVLARAASFAEELLVCDLDLDASRARAPARLAAAPRAPPPRAPAGDDRAPARRRAPVAHAHRSHRRRRARPPSCGARCASGSSTTCARTASSACCSASRAASTRRSWPRWPPTRSGPTASRPSRCRRATTARARAATRASSPSGSGSRSASSPIEELRLAFEGALPGHERAGGREPAGAHPRRAADDALQPARIARADDRQQVRDGRGLLDAVRRLGRRLRAHQGRPEDARASRSRATSTSRRAAS